ncbi:hypothetical protein LK540_04780 [Massilia sp. IC2-278]|uniref:preprotein translocase subunit SecA n=1 Tax=Massilia sp. IC2-278 TaxID=2887200 RepID=UPI001E4E04FC|nr:hypothetical protein [Massilia sp. IC2-278]MCC2959745.1 hypothetical protein [Massilia sp. IC2-278]
MDFDPRAPAELRRRVGRQAALAACAAGAFQADPALLTAARTRLRRAVALGQDADGSAATDALAALAAACRAAGLGTPSVRQLAAALLMHAGRAVESGAMREAGGAPLAVALAALLHVWSGRRCHLVRASDYLAGRDQARFAPLFALCGVSAAALEADLGETELARRYEADLVYATGRQLLSDLLRARLAADGMAAAACRPAAEVALVDDLDAVLAEEAASPVVISAAGSAGVLDAATLAACALVEELEAGRDYHIEREPGWQVRFSAAGQARLELLALRLPVYWRHPQRRDDIVSCALLARDELGRERHYLVQEGRVLIADDGVLRRLAGRVWQFGMLQAVEAREGLPLSAPPRTVARTAVQSFLPRYRRLTGIGASLRGMRAELRDCYGLETVALSAHAELRPQRRYGYRDAAAKLDAFADAVGARQARGEALLVGAPRTADLAAVGRLLAARQIGFALADGREPEADAATLAAAAEPGRVTLVIAAALRNGVQVEPESEPERGPERDADTGAGAQVHGMLFEHWDSARTDAAFFAWCASGEVFGAASDELLARALPEWLPLPVAGLARAPWTAAALFRLAQRNAARQASRYRASLALRERQMDEQLAFAGMG